MDNTNNKNNCIVKNANKCKHLKKINPKKESFFCSLFQVEHLLRSFQDASDIMRIIKFLFH